MDYNWQTITTTSASAEIPVATSGLYEIEVIAVSATGVRSQPTTFTQYVSLSQTLRPVDISGLNIVPLDDRTGILSWDKATDVIVYDGGSVIVRHQNVTTGAIWENAASIIPRVSGSESSVIVPLLTGTYLAKFESGSEVRSVNAASTSIDSDSLNPRANVSTIREDLTGFTGSASGVFYNPEKGGLTLGGKTLIDDIADLDLLLEKIDIAGGTGDTGEYIFASYYDIGNIYLVNIKRYLTMVASNILTEPIDEIMAELDTWGDFDGTDVSTTDVTLYVSSTIDNPAGTPTWTGWRVCTNNLIKARALKFKLVCTSDTYEQNIVVTELGATIEIDQRIERSAVISSGASAYSATFTNAFYDQPVVGISPLNMATGDYYTISSVSNTGFQVVFLNSGGSPISRQFTYTAVGYGRRL